LEHLKHKPRGKAVAKRKYHRKTDEERLAELHAKEAAIHARKAKKDVKSNPDLSNLVRKIEDTNRNLAVVRQSLNEKSPQSFHNRRLSHVLWIKECDAGEALAAFEGAYYTEARDYLNEAFKNLVSRMVNEDITSEEIQAVSDEIISTVDGMRSDELNEAEKAFESVQLARKNFSEEKKATKNSKTKNAGA
jgi:hypothetical protein